MRLSAVRFRAALLARRDGARVFSGTYLADERLAGWIDLPLSILVGAGFSVPDATRAWGTLLAFVQGFAVEEQAQPPGAGGDVEERFAFGVDVIVRGLESRLGGGRRRDGARATCRRRAIVTSPGGGAVRFDPAAWGPYPRTSARRVRAGQVCRRSGADANPHGNRRRPVAAGCARAQAGQRRALVT